jgi:hypothetical protein
MSKARKGRSPRRKAASRIPRTDSGIRKRLSPEKAFSGTKQSRAIAMLRSDGGVSIAVLMEAMGWQQHSVRGFLAGVVRKRLGLKLASRKVDGNRIYRIAGDSDVDSESSRPRRGS